MCQALRMPTWMHYIMSSMAHWAGIPYDDALRSWPSERGIPRQRATILAPLGSMDLDFEVHAGPGSGTRGHKRLREADDDLKGPWMPEEDAVLTRLVAVRTGP